MVHQNVSPLSVVHVLFVIATLCVIPLFLLRERSTSQKTERLMRLYLAFSLSTTPLPTSCTSPRQENILTGYFAMLRNTVYERMGRQNSAVLSTWV